MAANGKGVWLRWAIGIGVVILAPVAVVAGGYLDSRFKVVAEKVVEPVAVIAGDAKKTAEAAETKAEHEKDLEKHEKRDAEQRREDQARQDRVIADIKADMRSVLQEIRYMNRRGR